jgi:hypothetical protein
LLLETAHLRMRRFAFRAGLKIASPRIPENPVPALSRDLYQPFQKVR